jgi:hypothetical protein
VFRYGECLLGAIAADDRAWQLGSTVTLGGFSYAIESLRDTLVADEQTGYIHPAVEIRLRPLLATPRSIH